MTVTNREEVTVSVLGDVCANQRYYEVFESESKQNIFGSICSHIADSDISLVNLEAPLLRHGLQHGITKSGPRIFGNPKTARILADAGITIVNLGNNHIMDYGSYGINETIRLCREAGLNFLGAGENIEEARKPILIQVRGLAIGFYSMAESEFSIAAEGSPGANGIDPFNWVNDISELLKHTDAIIVLLHAGKEGYELPSPLQQKMCRRLISIGVSAVICQHSHCIGAFEEYKGGYISYGQGNLLFDSIKSQDDKWTSGYAIKINISKKDGVKYSHHYYNQTPKVPCIRDIEHSDLPILIENHSSISRLVSDPSFVEAEWMKVVARSGPGLLCNLLGIHGIFRRLVLRLVLLTRVFSGFKAACSLNVIRCETHREVIMDFLKNRIDN